MVENTNLYAQKKMEESDNTQQGRKVRWKGVTAQNIRIWVNLTIHMGCLGIPPAHYWRRDGKYLERDGLPTTPFSSQEEFEQIRSYFHISSLSILRPLSSTWYHKIDTLLGQVRRSSQVHRCHHPI